jgi:hypothetical protein
MKLSEHITVAAGHMESLLHKYTFAQQEEHNDKVNSHRWKLRSEGLRQRIDSMCIVIGITVLWPSVVPELYVESHRFVTFRDAMAASFGFESYVNLLWWEQNEADKKALVTEKKDAKAS